MHCALWSWPILLGLETYHLWVGLETYVGMIIEPTEPTMETWDGAAWLMSPVIPHGLMDGHE